jgi:hypothetical protein
VWVVVGVVWVVVGVVMVDFFGEVVVVCVVAVDVVWVAAVWVLDVLWLVDDVWVARALPGLGLLVVVVLAGGVDAIGVEALRCVVELVVEVLPPHAARLSVSATTISDVIRPRTLDGEQRRRNDLLLIRSDM